MIRIAFDIGGTFTDLVLEDRATGRRVVHKTPTTPADLAGAVMDGLDALLARAGRGAASVDTVLHATTIATNAILERKGSRTGVVTTRGFRDVLLLGRQKRHDTFDMYMVKPEPLTRRRFIFEVDERVAFDGAVVEPLSMSSVDRAIDGLADAGLESVAVCLLHAYANADHEAAVGARLAARAPGMSVSLSSVVSPRIREYERASTTVANAYVRPMVERYLDDLEERIAGAGFASALHVMQSNGGMVSTTLAKAHPVRIVESGPAAGVLMCAAVGRDEGFEHVLTLDMGGTTAKFGAIDDGVPAITPTFEVDSGARRRYSGLPLNVAAVELLEIGAGGGSVAETDMGLIRVGPESAGADPGPMCYGQGGEAPTLTDANLVLGYLDADYFNGGAMRLDAEAARAGIDAAIAGPLDLEPGEAAWGIHAVANSNMERAMRVISVERGRDPRAYALVAFGGAGPMHAARLARALGIPEVVVPAAAGVGSAIGLLDAEPRIDVSMTRLFTLEDGCHQRISGVYAELEARATGEIAGLAGGAAPAWSRYAYMRYLGQGFEIRVDLPGGAIGEGYAGRVQAAFHDAYKRAYGYRDDGARIEAVDWCLAAIAPAPERPQRSAAAAEADAEAPPDGVRQAYFPEAGGFVACPVYNRYSLAGEARIDGPAVIEEREATTVVLPGDVARVSARGNLIIAVGGGEGP